MPDATQALAASARPRRPRHPGLHPWWFSALAVCLLVSVAASAWLALDGRRRDQLLLLLGLAGVFASGELAAIVLGNRRVRAARRETKHVLNSTDAALQEPADSVHAVLWRRDSIRDALVMTDPAGRVVDLNPAAERLLGLKRGDARARGWLEVVSGDDGWPEAAIEASLAATGTYEGEVQRHPGTGEEALWEVGVVSIPEGRGRIIVLRDVAGGRHADKARERLQALVTAAAEEWQQTFDAIEAPILISDTQGVVRRLNRAALVLVGGAGYRDVLGRQIGAPGGPLWHEASVMLETIAANGYLPSATFVEHTGRYYDLSAVAVTRQGQAVDRLIWLVSDVTSVVQLQESLRRSEVMAALGSLVAGMAHEVRNPLFAITAALDTFEETGPRDPDSAELLQVLRRPISRLSHLARDLLELGKPGDPVLSPVSIEAVVGDAVESCRLPADERRVRVTSEVPAGLPTIRVDAARMTTALENLVGNAIQHSALGGEVRIAFARFEAVGTPWLRICVEDGGAGFAAEDLPRVFQPFFSRRRGGTGLGLSIAREIIERHGGQLGAANRPGGGAVLTVEIPWRLDGARQDTTLSDPRAEGTGGRG